MRQIRDRLILKMLPARQHTTQQHRRVHRRHFGIPHSFTRVDIRKVIEESTMRRKFVPQKRQALDHAPPSLRVAHETPLLTNAESCKSKACRRYACSRTRIRDADVTAILYQASLWIALLPEKEKICAFNLIQELVVIFREVSRSWRNRGLCMLLVVLCLLFKERKTIRLTQWHTQRKTSHLA